MLEGKDKESANGAQHVGLNCFCFINGRELQEDLKNSCSGFFYWFVSTLVLESSTSIPVPDNILLT